MNGTTARIAVANLSKVFDLQKRRKGRSGLSSRELAAMVQLGRSVLRRGVRVGRRFYALSDINLEVGSGEIMGIIGRNGAGKSTLLKILARVLDPTEGSVRLEGRVASLLELGAGFNGDLTVSENISLHIALSGSKPDPDLEKRILTLSELGDYRDIDLDDCPGGASARLSFATLISVNSDIVLADEMLAVGDTRFKQLCLDRIGQVRDEGGCVLFVSHDLRAIAQICDRVMWIDRGKMRLVGSAKEVIRAYEAELHAKISALDPTASDDAAQIIDLRLASRAGEPIGALRLNRASYLECVFQHLRPDIPISLCFELTNGRKQIIYSAARTIEPVGTDPRAMRGRLKIPPHFLNEAGYQARAKVRWKVDNEPRKEVEMKTDFRAVDSDASESVWAGWDGDRRGLVAPRLAWRFGISDRKRGRAKPL